MMPLDDKSYRISRNIDNTLKRAYFHMVRGCLGSHHKPRKMSFIPLQQHENWREDLHVIVCPSGAAWAYYIKVPVNVSAA